MRIAIVGSGVSGLVAARMLSAIHDVVVFEADWRLGGHVNTQEVEVGTAEAGQQRYQIDTGFIVCNDRTYPNFTRILRDLDVPTDPTSMSFSVCCERTGLEYNGTSLNGVFAQRRNLVRPSFLRMLRDILRFNREGPQHLETVTENETVGQFLALHRYSNEFAQQYLLPMGAAIWSCPCADFANFPIRFILEFYVNHGLLSLRDRPTWQVIRGGSMRYVERLVEPFRHNIRMACPVESVSRQADGVRVSFRGGEEIFDEIVFACHSDQALRLLADADSSERELLSAFPYSDNSAVLHTDERVLPKRRRAWASWNYHLPKTQVDRPTLTYNMNLLQQIDSPQTFCVTLNEDQRIAEEKVLARFKYSHPLFTVQRAAVQKRHREVIRRRRTSFCGAYWRNGFHEDGVVSGLAVCREFGIPDWSLQTKHSLPEQPAAEKPVAPLRSQPAAAAVASGGKSS
ncbi:NAD(P)/FAD-dependent oxidoreductase [Rosistilla oblonga]|uniref:NAD(P)/FAD-dependent oxidoreductase n=1 Tax=Rosistilla oblonga TaxID=2527990 RepID=UPI003A97D332